MERQYVVRWGMDGEMRCASIQTVVGQILLQLMRGYTEVRVSIENR